MRRHRGSAPRFSTAIDKDHDKEVSLPCFSALSQDPPKRSAGLACRRTTPRRQVKEIANPRSILPAPGPAGLDWEVDPEAWFESVEVIVCGAFLLSLPTREWPVPLYLDASSESTTISKSYSAQLPRSEHENSARFGSTCWTRFPEFRRVRNPESIA